MVRFAAAMLALGMALAGCGADDGQAGEIDVVTYLFDRIPYPLVAVVDTPEDFAAATDDALGIDLTLVGADWATEALVVFALPSNSCGRDLVGFEPIDGDLIPVWEFPEACNSDERSLNLVAAVSRAILTEGDQLVLPARPPFFTADVRTPIEITAPPEE